MKEYNAVNANMAKISKWTLFKENRRIAVEKYFQAKRNYLRASELIKIMSVLPILKYMSKNVDKAVRRRLRGCARRLIIITVGLRFRARCKKFGPNLNEINRSKIRHLFTFHENIKFELIKVHAMKYLKIFLLKFQKKVKFTKQVQSVLSSLLSIQAKFRLRKIVLQAQFEVL